MTFLREFSYPDVSQRRFMLLNSFVSFIILSFIYIYSSLILNYYFLYNPVMRTIFLSGLSGIFTGNLAGKFLFAKLKKHRQIFLTADVLFILTCLFYIYGRILIPLNHDPLIYLYINSPIYSALPVFFISLFAGIKINYFLKISCGDFIDNKRAAIPFLLFLLAGIALGAALALIVYCHKGLYYYSGILFLAVLPTLFFIKLSYNPSPIYAQELKENASTPAQNNVNFKRDDLFFIYLNFTYIFIYVFLGFTAVVKYFGDFTYIKIFFILISLASVITGILSSRLVKQAFWFIYAEMLYPLLFLIFLAAIIIFKDQMSFLAASFVFIPAAILLGFSLSQTLNHILLSNSHKNRFNVIEFSLLILPAPILISLNFVDFTNFWYFVLLYVIALMNIFIPGIYLTQSTVRGYKKIIYVICALIFIPLLILMHIYFNIPLNSKLYINSAKGFDSLNNANSNAQYIENEGAVFINGIKSFQADEPTIKNMKRAVAPALLYADSNSGNETLFIDGNRKFFKNPVISLIKNTNVLDYLPDRITDFRTLPISGDQNYILEHSEIITYLYKRNSSYKIITDIPNLYDQAFNAFRFSKEYYNIIKDKLKAEGIFIQVLATGCRKDFIAAAARNLKKTFNKTIIYYFPDYLVFLSSQKPGALQVNQAGINSFKEAFDINNQLVNIFYNEFHLLSHILFLEIDDFIVYATKENISPLCILQRPDNFLIDKNLIAGFVENNSGFLDLIDKSNPNYYFYANMQNQFASNKFFLPDVKKSELSEVNREYENESLQLINLRRLSEYKPDLRKYIWNLLFYKENYYYNAAVKFEKIKKWEEARKLYKAILSINKNHFEANYHLGMLSIILQDLDSSFVHLQYAMMLKKDDPKVLYQMGVLLYSSGRPREAITFFEKAMSFKEKTSLLFYYLGLCHEAVDNLSAAGSYFNQAIVLDPNDKNIISGIERIKEKNKLKYGAPSQDEQQSNSEVEKGEDMPLPITESAINVRIEEENNNKEEKK